MNILLWIVFGALAGWIASIIMKSNQGLLINIIVGILGSVIGGWVMNFFNQAGTTGFNIYSLLVAILGAVILIWIVRLFRK